MNRSCCNGQCPSMRDSLMSDLNESERCKLRENSVLINLKKGQNVFEQEYEAQGIFCIKKGKIKTSLETESGESVTINLYSETGMIGHHILFNKKNLYTATCLTDAEVCFLPQAALNQHIENSPIIRKRLQNIISNEFSELNSIIVSLRTKSITQRLADILIRLQNFFGTDDEKFIGIELTKDEISNLIGTSIESVFRTISTFREKGYIECEGRKIKILDEAKLRSISGIIV